MNGEKRRLKMISKVQAQKLTLGRKEDIFLEKKMKS